MKAKPVFPIKVYFKEDGDEWIHHNEKELAYNLEWFDSDDIEEETIVTDQMSRKVRLKIKALQIIVLELE